MNVRDAAKRLDEIEPNWFNKIDFETIDMNDCKNCILGQIFGYYDDGIMKIFPEKEGRDGFFGAVFRKKPTP